MKVTINGLDREIPEKRKDSYKKRKKEKSARAIREVFF